MKGLNLNPETLTLLEENTGCAVRDPGVRKDFLTGRHLSKNYGQQLTSGLLEEASAQLN